MIRTIRNYFCIIAFLISFQKISFAQSGASPYFLSSRHNSYIEYLINSGKLPANFAISQPVLSQELIIKMQDSSVFNSYWSKLLLIDLKEINKARDSATEIGSLNFLGDLDNSSEISFDSKKNITNSTNGRLGFIYKFKNVVFVNRLEADQRFLDDTLYFNSEGKLQNKNFGRLKDSYLSWQNKHTEFLIGRQDRNLGNWNTPGLILSDNAFSFDQVSLSLKNKLLKFNATLSRLNDIYGYDVRSDSTNFQWNKRYLSIHRLELNPHSELSLAITESVLYGGTEQQPIYNYLNPANFFFLSKIVDRTGFEQQTANVLMAAEVFYKPNLNTSIYGQLLVDDVDFTKKLRAIYPDRLGGIIKASVTDLIPNTQINAIYTRISNWTYNSFYTWGNYTSYGKSLGYPQNGVQRFDLKLIFFGLQKIRYELGFTHETFRKPDLLTHFMPLKTGFPIGVSQTNFIANSNITYFFSKHISTAFSANYISSSNSGHIPGIKTSNFYVGLKLNGYGFLNLF